MSIMISLTLSFIFFFFSLINAFNITEILSEHPDFSTFNHQLTQTQLATTINARRTITVLVVDNAALSGISGMSTDEAKKVLSLHAVLDYYDIEKLEKMSGNGKSRILTTLFQASGQANGQQGFLNATKTENGIVLGSAVAGSSLKSNLMRSVAAQPYNISVLQVSSVIVPPNLINSTALPPSKSPTPATAPAPALAPSNGSANHVPPPHTAAPAPAPSDSPISNAPKASTPSDGALPDSGGGGLLVDAPETASAFSSSATAYCNSLGFRVGAVMWSLIMGAF